MSLPLPTIVVVTCYADAAGFMFALSHDYFLMRMDHGMLYMSELDLGLSFYEYLMGLMITKITSPLALKSVVLEASKLNAKEVMVMGIVDSVHDTLEEIVNTALCLGEELGSRK
ncbi:hypothetical protein GIB67_008793 [Kingdonia uniflora]|uniref:Uncharacterized protein n=1 Tax=Kingdonia uniflora TaxID=39325 RepID=A0A7J7MHY5_9MAGN|nr:hypothetical protein GIB67_008793 [Kingdonia uniflora]